MLCMICRCSVDVDLCVRVSEGLGKIGEEIPVDVMTRGMTILYDFMQVILKFGFKLSEEVRFTLAVPVCHTCIQPASCVCVARRDEA